MVKMPCAGSSDKSKYKLFHVLQSLNFSQRICCLKTLCLNLLQSYQYCYHSAFPPQAEIIAVKRPSREHNRIATVRIKSTITAPIGRAVQSVQPGY